MAIVTLFARIGPGLVPSGNRRTPHRLVHVDVMQVFVAQIFITPEPRDAHKARARLAWYDNGRTVAHWPRY